MKQKKQVAGKQLTNIPIPTLLFEKIKERIKETEFVSVSDYVTYVLNEILSEDEEEKPLTEKDEEKIKERLKALGYLD